jgi:hypothetical protein
MVSRDGGCYASQPGIGESKLTVASQFQNGVMLGVLRLNLRPRESVDISPPAHQDATTFMEKISQEYLRGPTACLAHPSVMKSIRQQVRASRVLSAGDFRLARRLGLIASPRPAAFGFNDDIIYPP